MQETEQHVTRSNMGVYDQSYLQLKLDMQKLHSDVLHFLEGSMTFYEYDEGRGRTVEVVKSIGTALANRKGVQNLLNFVVSVVNQHTVQGNTKRDQLNDILLFMHKHLAEQLMANCEDWGIDRKNRRHIIRTIMILCNFALSRTVDDKERQYHTPGIERTSVIRENADKKKFGII
jgi:hypothetical protein